MLRADRRHIHVDSVISLGIFTKEAWRIHKFSLRILIEYSNALPFDNSASTGSSIRIKGLADYDSARPLLLCVNSGPSRSPRCRI